METIRSEVKSAKSSFEWPPKIDNLETQQTLLTPHLKVFLSKLFGSKGYELDVKVKSLGQDILYVLNNRTFLTTKHILLPFTVKTLTGNVELLKILNRLGHGVSYSKVAEIEVALASQKLSEAETIVPSAIQRNIPATLVFDNIDRLEETLSGSGTTHRVNGIVVQQAFIGPTPFKQELKLPKTRKRSIKAPIQELPIYISGKKPEAPLKGPIAETFLQNNVALLKNFVWALSRYSCRDLQCVSSWTGFNMLTRRNEYVLKDFVGYLPTIDSPATQMNTVYEVLCKANAIKDNLNLRSIIVVLDQAIYSKAIEIIGLHLSP